MQQKIAALELGPETVASMLARIEASALDALTPAQFDTVKAELVALQ